MTQFIYRQWKMWTDPNWVLVSEKLFWYSISLCIMVGNADGERSVCSLPWRRSTNLRNLLGHEQLEKLIRVSHNKVRVEDFVLGTAVDIFLAASDRRLWIDDSSDYWLGGIICETLMNCSHWNIIIHKFVNAIYFINWKVHCTTCM